MIYGLELLDGFVLSFSVLVCLFTGFFCRLLDCEFAAIFGVSLSLDSAGLFIMLGLGF